MWHYTRVTEEDRFSCRLAVLQVRAVFGEDPRQYSVMTKEFLSDDDGNVRGLITVEVEVTKDGIKVSQRQRQRRQTSRPGV